MRILDRGTSSIQTIMAVVIFNVVPQLVDICTACIYMATALEVCLSPHSSLGHPFMLTILAETQCAELVMSPARWEKPPDRTCLTPT